MPEQSSQIKPFGCYEIKKSPFADISLDEGQTDFLPKPLNLTKGSFRI